MAVAVNTPIARAEVVAMARSVRTPEPCRSAGTSCRKGPAPARAPVAGFGVRSPNGG